jgi:hypothetical protein
MALHRDIHWIGRQWAVTGFGVQAIDRKLGGKFDIEVTRLWEEGLEESLRGQTWLKAEDFRKALAKARARYPAPGHIAVPPEQISLPVRDRGPLQPRQRTPPAEEIVSFPKDGVPAEPRKLVIQEFRMRIVGCRARFVRPWRARLVP